ncbi:MAG: hypothetical protein AB1414_04310 [bacterium]
MTWSRTGSTSLASITAIVRNNEHKRWFEEGNIGEEKRILFTTY